MSNIFLNDLIKNSKTVEIINTRHQLALLLLFTIFCARAARYYPHHRVQFFIT